jgi:hypothetical protein
MMLNGAEKCQLKGPIDLLAPYSSGFASAIPTTKSSARGSPDNG